MKLRYKVFSTMLAVFLAALGSLAVAISYTSECEPPSSAPAGSDLMQAVVYRCYGSADVLRLEQVAKPVPADDEVRVKVRAAAVNPLDWHFMRGSPYLMRLMAGLGSPDDIRMGVDFSGVVEAVGKNVERFSIGDEVFGAAGGAFAEYLVIGQDRSIVLKPENVSFDQAAAVPIAAVTALQALRDKGRLKAGDRVLVNGASGGVGTFAVQIAKAMGARVSGVCSTRNVELVDSIGADRVYDYKKESYLDSDEQFDLIVDMVGNYSLLANRRVMTEHGRLVMVGGEKGDWIAPLKRPLMAMLLSPFVSQEFPGLLAEINQSELAVLAELMESGKVTPVIDRRYPLQEIAEAIRYSESGRARGKIIIKI